MTDNSGAFRARRSVLFMSGLRPDDFDETRDSGADLICIDIEDAVPPDRKERAREATRDLLRHTSPDDRVQTAVRINCLRSPDGLRDMLCFVESDSPPPAIVLPKVATAAEVQWADELLQEAARPVDLYIIVECNEGLREVYEIAQSSRRLKALFFGGFDMSAALGAKMSWATLFYGRSRTCHAAALAGLDVLDSPFPDLEDEAGLVQSIDQARDLGFVGKAAKHPSQIEAINHGFTPSADDIERAREIIGAFRKSSGGSVIVNGKMIEAPTIRAMERMLAIAEAMGRSPSSGMSDMESRSV